MNTDRPSALTPQECRRVLRDLASGCDPDASRPVGDDIDTPVTRLRRCIDTEHHDDLTAALAYVEERGRLAGARLAFRHAERLLTEDAADDKDATVVGLITARIHRRS
ncbi:hypothetical protein [Haloechinothrix halophila]|uniref:hypothetical protein n=1 Tax=Haloechinothrix halophila TaxID=1069073 RepID=UPI000416B7E5|nr:hypothetical protein [Haloechinothrix halophila]